MIAELMHRNLAEVFGQRDESLRRKAMLELFVPDITVADHDGVVSGFDAVDEKIAALHARTPGFVFTEVGPVNEVSDLGSVDWNFGPPDAPATVKGTDVVLVADGRIRALYVYLRS